MSDVQRNLLLLENVQKGEEGALEELMQENIGLVKSIALRYKGRGTDYEDLVQTLKLVNNYLDPQGVFIFDMNTVHKYRDLIGDRTIAEARAECSFIWDNDYDPETKINEYDLTLFIQEEDDLYRRFVETHYQKAYQLEEVKRAIAEAGMEFVTVYDAFTRKAPDENSERVYFIAREQGKHW